jgi:DNA-binding LacI/PurR family transcriptional regulator
LEREYIDDLVSHRVEGLMLAPASDRSRSSILTLLRGSFPLVLIDRALPDVECDVIVSDNVGGARRLVEHLISVGHRLIAHITDAEDTSTGRERLEGYREALATNGVEFRSELVVRTTVDRIGGFRAAQEILTRHPLPTAIFTVNNMTAVGAMQALRERGMSVPEQMGLVCFDDVEQLVVLSPFLTVVDQPSKRWKSRAAAARADEWQPEGTHAESRCKQTLSFANPAALTPACRGDDHPPCSRFVSQDSAEDVNIAPAVNKPRHALTINQLRLQSARLPKARRLSPGLRH